MLCHKINRPGRFCDDSIGGVVIQAGGNHRDLRYGLVQFFDNLLARRAQHIKINDDDIRLVQKRQVYRAAVDLILADHLQIRSQFDMHCKHMADD